MKKYFYSSEMDRAEIHQLSMWPPHILTKNGTLSPSAMIPFCSLGQDIAKITTKIDQFDMPVCSIFEKIIFHDQLCYQVDLNKFYDNFSTDALILLIDPSVDRRHSFEDSTAVDEEDSFVEEIFSYNHLTDADTFTVHIGTLGGENLFSEVFDHLNL